MAKSRNVLRRKNKSRRKRGGAQQVTTYHKYYDLSQSILNKLIGNENITSELINRFAKRLTNDLVEEYRKYRETGGDYDQPSIITLLKKHGIIYEDILL